ncbi:endoflagellar biogenesis protein [Leptospira idonii]|uniref:Endoflagellar biogenesis protein n=2 Tax=Leptospira idonii TaxID=1193500 RepID=A0A4R9M7Y8_9LEPT|nr:endoflagellar biogenesis protein [Leptospira idonii]
MYTLVLLSFFTSPVFSQTASDRKELDQILRKELGESEPKTKSETAPEKQETRSDSIPTEESNPIQERYTEGNDDSPSATWILLKILFVLGILVGAGYYLVIKMQATKAAKYPVKGFMKVLSSLSLSPSQTLQIVEVGNRILVLGVADGSVSLITEINAQDEKSQITKMRDEADPYVPNFLETILENLQNKAQSKKIRINKNLMETGDVESSSEIQRRAKENLERLRKHREMLEGGQS